MVGHSFHGARPQIPTPSIVRDSRFKERWGILKRHGNRAGAVQFGLTYEKLEWIRYDFLEAVPEEEIRERLAKEAEGLV